MTDLERAQGGDESAFARLVAPHRGELRAYCYRMSGAAADADDLLQETLVRAWRGIGGFEGRATLRTWLYRVATTSCLDALKHRSRRLLPMDLGPAAKPESVGPPRLEPIWITPCPDAWISPTPPDASYDARESVALAFLAAIQHLPARQRAALLLFDVLGFQAKECAELLEMSPTAVNSALARARETLSTRTVAEPAPLEDPATRDLLARYVAAWEEADIEALVALLRHDAVLAMPPIPQWLVGPEAIRRSIGEMVLRPEARGHIRMLATRLSHRPAFAMYVRQDASGFQPASLHLPFVEDGEITTLISFGDPALFRVLELPLLQP